MKPESGASVWSAIERAGDQTAGLLLYRIWYWQPKAKIKRGEGLRWVAKTRKEWAAECKMTFEQAKDGLKLLRQTGFIETQQGLFGNRNILHLRLTPEGAPSHAQEWPAGPAPYTKTYGMGSNKLLKKKLVTRAGARGGEGKKDSEEDDKSEKDGMSVSGGTAVMTLKKKKTPPLQLIADPEITVIGQDSGEDEIEQPTKQPMVNTQQLWVLWRSRFGDKFGFCKSWTGQQWGQAKLLLKALPLQTNFETVDMVLKDWPQFIGFCEEKFSAWKPPKVPDVGFLLKHAQAAIMWHALKTAKPSQPVGKKMKKVVADAGAKVPPAVVKPEDLPATLDEVLDALGD